MVMIAAGQHRTRDQTCGRSGEINGFAESHLIERNHNEKRL